MNRAQMDKLLEVIDAKIAKLAAADSSDGGLIESVRESELLAELKALCDDDEEG